ncbi:MAG: hypothetical protein IKE95_04660, partial [Methanobrevibacter sp.]|nr:hypothetical protein [Methanobrevibacter sp.]
MATQTTYYEFNKPAGNDLVNPLVDTNPNWDKADAALHGLSINSIGTAVEVITLGVHALTRINQPDAKFFTFIATGDFDAGETFTLDGVAITAALPDGSALESDCYVTGACVLVGLNADNTLATFFLPSTGATAPDSERLGGELPAYYATAAALANAVQTLTDLNNLMGNTSIASIGDGTATGAISALNSDLVELEGKIMRTLDFANAEVVAKNVPYTTIKDGVYLVSFSSSSSGDLTIDGVSIFSNTGTTAATTSVSFELPLKPGTVISNTLSGADSNKNYV